MFVDLLVRDSIASVALPTNMAARSTAVEVRAPIS